METLKQILTIPENHKLHFDVTLPETFPTGLAEVVLVFASKTTSPFSLQRTTKDFLKLAGSLKDSPHFSGDPVAIQKALRDDWKR